MKTTIFQNALHMTYLARCRLCGDIVESDFAIDMSVPMNEIPEWFPRARLNYAENLLR